METNDTVETNAKCVTKRIPVSISTWEEIWKLREPGETFDSVCSKAAALLRKEKEGKNVEE